jgi:hypothetical protein
MERKDDSSILNSEPHRALHFWFGTGVSGLSDISFWSGKFSRLPISAIPFIISCFNIHILGPDRVTVCGPLIWVSTRLLAGIPGALVPIWYSFPLRVFGSLVKLNAYLEQYPLTEHSSHEFH